MRTIAVGQCQNSWENTTGGVAEDCRALSQRRFPHGIARSYNCTAPAIRYIVARVSARGAKGKKMDRDKPQIAVLAPADNRRAMRIGSVPPGSPMRDIWGRINTDIATFL